MCLPPVGAGGGPRTPPAGGLERQGMYSPGWGRLGKDMATRRSKQPPPTVVLFVRHARTPTTGSVLPGRAPGLHLADGGGAAAEKRAARLASPARLEAVSARPPMRARKTTC